MKKFLTALVVVLAVACGSNWIVPAPPETEEGSVPEAEPVADSGTPPETTDPDAGCPIEEPVTPVDAGIPPEDAGEPSDAGSPPDSGTPPEDAGTPPVDAGDGKVALCHVPRGNPSNEHTIRVGEPALSAHLRHGDYLGPCRNGN